MESLKRYLEENGFDTGEQTVILSLFEKKWYRKGDYFLQESQFNTSLGFVQSGVFQFFYNHDGNEITTYIAGENDFIVSLSSFLQQIPAKENIRALIDAEVWLISKPSFDRLKRSSEKFAHFYVALLESQIVCIDNSRFNLITLSAEERYQKMMEVEPHLLQQIPLQYLASILGVTPRHLSRIRKSVR